MSCPFGWQPQPLGSSGTASYRSLPHICPTAKSTSAALALSSALSPGLPSVRQRPRHPLPCLRLRPTLPQGIAATPSDSQERFRARAFWPSYAKRLRAVAEAAPVVAGLVIGGDKEATLSQMYGGTGSGDAAVSGARHVTRGTWPAGRGSRGLGW